MKVTASGSDPYLYSPDADFTAGQLLWMTVRLRASTAGTAQIFYSVGDRGITEENSVRFSVQGGRWETVRVPLPALGLRTRFRFDPPGSRGDTTVLAEIAFAPRVLFLEPKWPAPVAPDLTRSWSLTSGRLTLHVSPTAFNGIGVDVDGRRMAVGNTRPLLGYVYNGKTRWLDLARTGKFRVERHREGIVARLDAKDADGAKWTLWQMFNPVKGRDAIRVETRVSINRERRVLYLPLLTLLPGVGAFGSHMNQALFAGLEYLGKDEPSSSEADLKGPEAHRQVPDAHKVTLPLMAVQAEGRYVALTWQRNDAQIAALFDSPDRTFRGGGHLLGLIFPGAKSGSREEGQLLPYEPVTIKPGTLVTVQATLLGGKGDTIVPAVQQYVALHGLPKLPNYDLDWNGYAKLSAGGWLDSKIRQSDLYRHAYWPGFEPQNSADAALFMLYLRDAVTDISLRARLNEAALNANLPPPADAWNTAAISHIRTPAPALVFGMLPENMARAESEARQMSQSLPLAPVPYRPGKKDYGRTHYENHANGHSAPAVIALLEAAALSGDPELKRNALRHLRALNLYDGTVPRGAQTWEVPLHTPDILASAHLVRAYVLGYELTGEADLLERARYWAWTGVPFVYLTNPTGQAVGPYATIAVLGATDWVAPVWFGRPVQWCGLVYADALYQLAAHDSRGPWKRLADGITASGIQQAWKQNDPTRQGLLPDFYLLLSQQRDGPAINPGTLMFNAVRFYGRMPLYSRVAVSSLGLMIHAPGAIRELKQEDSRVTFTVDGWPERYAVLVSGIAAGSNVKLNGRPVGISYRDRGRVVLEQLTGRNRIEIELQ